MSNLLYLVHRLPYPPNKGDKVRSYHLLKHLRQSHRIFLATFIDDPEDEQYVDAVSALCDGLYIARITPLAAKVRGLHGLLSQEPLSLTYYRHPAVQAWVNQICATHRIDAAVVFSAVMGQYVENKPRLPMLVDFVDVDSAKWSSYAPKHRWPMSWIYRREGERLLAYERSLAAKADRSFFVTDQETALFRRLAPECSVRVETVCNGVDAAFFSPLLNRANPFPEGQIPIVFTGAMDYWPNIDAVDWFAKEIFPEILAQHPQACFYIVGRNPPEAVSLLASERVVVTGTVPDIRAYLQYAAAVVAPLRVARGIQNKILEAMAMARPVVASRKCVEVITADNGTALLSAETATEFVQQLNALLADPSRSAAIGEAGRECVLQQYSWDAHLSKLDRYLPQIMADTP